MFTNLELHFEFDGLTFLVGDEPFFSKDLLREVEEEIVSESHRESLAHRR
jgi:hypothetical protein